MDKKLIAAIVGILLGAAGAIWGFDFKGAICDKPANAQSAELQGK